MVALDAVSYAMFSRPDNFKPIGMILGFGLIGIGAMGWLLTLLDGYDILYL